MSIKILPYKLGSKTAKALAREVGGIRIHHKANKSKYRGSSRDIIYNYGNASKGFSWLSRFIKNRRLLNHPDAIRKASSKVTAFQIVQQYLSKGKHQWYIPKFTTKRSEATTMAGSGVVYCRTLTRASEGRGIVVAHNAGEVVSAPLYTEGLMNTKREYRAHVFNGEVIDLVAKATASGGENPNQEIRSHDNGWIFTRDAIKIPSDVKKIIIACAVETCETLGIDVAAVDILRTTDNKVYMLEVNTAPGMEGTTIKKYAKALVVFHDTIINHEPQSAGGFFNG